MNEIKAALFEVSETIMSTRDSALEQHAWANQAYKDQREGWNAAVDFALGVLLKKIKEVEGNHVEAGQGRKRG